MKILLPKDNPGGVKCSLMPLNFLSLIKVFYASAFFFFFSGKLEPITTRSKPYPVA